jgi:hypothetical protein
LRSQSLSNIDDIESNLARIFSMPLDPCKQTNTVSQTPNKHKSLINDFPLPPGCTLTTRGDPYPKHRPSTRKKTDTKPTHIETIVSHRPSSS